jgi:hypothetical protein
MSSSNHHNNGNGKNGTRARGSARIPRRQRGKPNPAVKAALLIVIALVLAGAIARRVIAPLSPRHLTLHEPSQPH